MKPIQSFRLSKNTTNTFRRLTFGYRFRQWKWAAIDLFAPPSCVGCGRVGSSWCQKCESETAFITEAVCVTCGGPLQGENCPHCEAYPSYFDQALSYSEYKDPFRQTVLHLKYQRDHALGDVIAGLVSEIVRTFAGGADLVCPVPLGPNRLANRGYNQVDVFAKPLAERLKIAYIADAITRTHDTRSQVGLTGAERRQNLAEVFTSSRDNVFGKRVLLVDDVFTTGATGNTCAKSLKSAGALSVQLFTLARATGHMEVNIPDALK